MKKIITSLCHLSLCGLILLSFGCANKSSSLTAHVPTKEQAKYQSNPPNKAVLISNQAPMRSIAYVNATPQKKAALKEVTPKVAPTKIASQKVSTQNSVAEKTSPQKTEATKPTALQSVATKTTTRHKIDPKAIAMARAALPKERIVAEDKSTKGAIVIPKAKSVIGVRYVYGGTTTQGFDCSGFVQWVYNHAGVKLPRTARDQSRSGVAIKRTNMKVGDIVAFRHPRIGYHTGIYIGENKFIHSPRRNKSIQVSDLSVSYFRRNYIGARRVAELGVAEKNAADNLLSQYTGKKLGRD